MTNVIPLRKTSFKDGVCEPTRDVQALYARVLDLQSATRSLAQQLQMTQADSKAADALANASQDLERAADQILDAVASAIVHHAVTLVVPAAVASDTPADADAPV